MTTLTPGENEIFAFTTKADRTSFIAALKKADPSARYATNLDPDMTQAARWLVAVRHTSEAQDPSRGRSRCADS